MKPNPLALNLARAENNAVRHGVTARPAIPQCVNHAGGAA